MPAHKFEFLTDEQRDGLNAQKQREHLAQRGLSIEVTIAELERSIDELTAAKADAVEEVGKVKAELAALNPDPPKPNRAARRKKS